MREFIEAYQKQREVQRGRYPHRHRPKYKSEWSRLFKELADWEQNRAKN